MSPMQPCVRRYDHKPHEYRARDRGWYRCPGRVTVPEVLMVSSAEDVAAVVSQLVTVVGKLGSVSTEFGWEPEDGADPETVKDNPEAPVRWYATATMRDGQRVTGRSGWGTTPPIQTVEAFSELIGVLGGRVVIEVREGKQ